MKKSSLYTYIVEAIKIVFTQFALKSCGYKVDIQSVYKGCLRMTACGTEVKVLQFTS